MDVQGDLPGATPLDDSSGLKIKGIRTLRELNEAEFKNITLVREKYLARRPTARTAPFTRKWMLKLHKEAFGRVWKWAGKIRKMGKNIGLPPHQINVALEELARDLAVWMQSGNMDLVEQSVRLHHRAVTIHPFENGNGRWARLQANIWLRRHSGEIVMWPEETIRDHTSVIRNEYLACLKDADNSKFGPLINLHSRYLAPFT